MAWVLPVLLEENLDHIAAHKYSPGHYTALDYVLSHLWQGIAEALPKWLAPNAITFIGFAPLVLVYILSWFICPFCDEAPPRWLALSYVGALYFYQTMDAVDGKQARRTGSSTPLGHLVDHGCDCLTGMSQHAALVMILMPADMHWVFQCMRSIQTPIFLAAWHDRHAGFFPTSLGPIGVTELQYMLMSPILLTAVVGPEVWQRWMTATVELPWASENVRILIVKAWLLQSLAMALFCIVRAMGTVCASRGFAGVSALKDLLPVLLLNVLLGLWHPGLVAAAGRMISLFTGLSIFWMNVQMIVFTMAGTCQLLDSVLPMPF